MRSKKISLFYKCSFKQYACILAVGKIKETPIVENGEIKIGHVIKMTLSSDHRVVDGSIASGFLKSLKENLENPAMMLI